jgi:hypothetical protein
MREIRASEWFGEAASMVKAPMVKAPMVKLNPLDLHGRAL